MSSIASQSARVLCFLSPSSQLPMRQTPPSNFLPPSNSLPWLPTAHGVSTLAGIFSSLFFLHYGSLHIFRNDLHLYYTQEVPELNPQQLPDLKYNIV